MNLILILMFIRIHRIRLIQNQIITHRTKVKIIVVHLLRCPISVSKRLDGTNITEERTVQHGDVNVKSKISTDGKSTVSMANQQKLNDLVSRLGSTHTQIDQYAKKQTEKINEETKREIDQVVSRTRVQQEELLRRANEHTAEIDAEYRARLQKMVEEIDAIKAKRIGEIETQLNQQQADILQAARNEIDQINQKAAGLKIGVLQDAQAKAAADATAITAQAAQLSQASTIHEAKGTTTIKTEVTAATTTKEKDAAAVGAVVVNGTARDAENCEKTGSCSTKTCHETKTNIDTAKSAHI